MSTRDEQWKTLWKAEKAHCQEYTGLRAIMDWQGYTDSMTNRRKAAWHWIDDRIADIKAGKYHDDDKGQDQDRIEYMQAVLDGYSNYGWKVPAYPREKATDVEAAYIKERAYYASFFGDGMEDEGEASPVEEQQKRKRSNYDWLVSRRQWILDCVHGDVDGQPPGWDVKGRRQRYDNLNIATHHGDQWTAFKKGTYVPRGEPSGWREASEKWHESHVGLTEDPPNSNSDNRKDGIRNAQDTCANGTWLRNQPWCGVWAFMGLYQSDKVKSGSDSWMASVASCEDYAKAGKGPFRGWTTDGSKAKKGDLVILFGRGQHVGTVREITSSVCKTWEGNTSSGSSGSQSNGGGSYKRDRSRSSEVYGYCLVRD